MENGVPVAVRCLLMSIVNLLELLVWHWLFNKFLKAMKLLI